MKGYNGKILHINLSDGKSSIEEPDEKFYRTWVGGAGFGAYYVAKMVPKDADALSEQNILAFSLSAITGAALSGAARHCVSCKSPQTGTIAASEAGGFWGPELKFAGFDGLIITGKSEKPVYLWIKDGNVELRDASEVWGRDTGYTEDWIRGQHSDRRIRVAQIGPAGENLVRYAGIVNELKHFNGRNGMGAVMGSKNLKAIAVRGSSKPEFAEPQVIKDYARKAGTMMKEEGFFPYFKRVGTTINVEGHIPVGGLPTRNWRSGTFEQQDNLTGEKYADTMMENSGTCFACVQSCKRAVKPGIETPEHIDPRFGGPEYETVGMCGSNLGIGDLNEICAINQYSSMNAVDSISLGGVIGFVMECCDHGLIAPEQLDGINASFGDYNSVMALAEKIVKRDGIGDILADGTAAAVRYFGPETAEYAVHVKNKDFPAHMPHIKASLSLAYALNNFGPDHVSSEHDGGIAAEPIGERLQGFGFYNSHPGDELNLEKARLFAYSQRWVSGIDSICVCNFIFNTWTMFGFDDLIKVFNAATGWEYSVFEMMQLGERRINLMRAFNCREGFGVEDDDLPGKLFEQPLSDSGPSSGLTVDRKAFLECREYYYGLNGWNPETGVPSKYKMFELGIDWFKM